MEHGQLSTHREDGGGLEYGEAELQLIPRSYLCQQAATSGTQLGRFID